VLNRRYLRIFLTERLLLMHAGHALTVRMRRTAGDDALRDVIDAATTGFARGQAELASFLRQLGVGQPRARLWLVDLGERAGRLKLNGRVSGRSPLSDLQELDALSLLAQSALSAWTAIERAEIAAADTVRAQMEAFEAIGTRVEPLRRDAAARILGAA
jgi:hypothetical protein